MTRTADVGAVKARLSQFVARITSRGGRVLVERRGKPIAALVSLEDWRRLEDRSEESQKPGFLGLIGIWDDLISKDEWDSIVKHIYEERAKDHGRPVDLGF